MVDYTSPKSSGSGIWLVLAAVFVVAVLLYALYAGSGANEGATTPATLDGLPETTAPAALPTE